MGEVSLVDGRHNHAFPSGSRNANNRLDKARDAAYVRDAARDVVVVP